jgi:hypothetical protein
MRMVAPKMGGGGMADDNEFRIDIDLDHAEREAQRIRDLLAALRRRHDLSRFEFTRHVRIVPAGPTHSHPILTLGTRFAETEDLLLATYLHEQMHWYLWRFGGPDYDPIAPFFDELVRRYPMAPIKLPEGARSYEQTYVHLVVCWLEVEALTQLIGSERAHAIADTQWGYRWIYRTAIADREPLRALLAAHGLAPIRSPADIPSRPPQPADSTSAARKRTRRGAGAPRSRRSRRRSPARGGRLRG